MMLENAIPRVDKYSALESDSHIDGLVALDLSGVLFQLDVVIHVTRE